MARTREHLELGRRNRAYQQAGPLEGDSSLPRAAMIGGCGSQSSRIEQAFRFLRFATTSGSVSFPGPERTDAGYRDYDEDSATRLLFVSRARGLGIGLERIAELLPAWRGTNCESARDRIVSLIDEKRAEISARIAELSSFDQKLQEVRDSFEAVPAPTACRTDLSCCVPATAGGFVPAELLNPVRR